MIQRILVPLDGSELAETVLPWVENIAVATSAQVRLIQIADNEADPAAGSYLMATQSALRAPSVETKVIQAKEPPQAILADAEAWNADLIAMSTHGRSGVTRWVFGSVADKVAHTTERPLLLVRARPSADRPPARLEHILLPLDGSELSMSVLPYVEDLARALNAGIVLFNAVIPLHLYPGTEMTSAPVSIIDDLMDQAKAYLAEVEKEVSGRGVKTRALATIGFPVDEIVRGAEESGVGLIAMATHGRSGVNRWVMGSVADGVMRRSSLPVLMLRPEGLTAKE